MDTEVFSYLSPYVREILVDFASDDNHVDESQEESQYAEDFVSDSLLLNWKTVDLLFANNDGTLSDDFNILSQPVEWYKTALKRVWRVLHTSGESLLRATSVNRRKLFHGCNNLKANIIDLEMCFNQFISNSVDSKLKTLLILTASIERFLGNVYLAKGKNVPFLLRDLLLTDEITVIFGRIKVVYTQLLIGCPLGLNVRNIAWHGFLTEDDIHPHLVASLFILLASLNEFVNTLFLWPSVSERVSINLDVHSKLIIGTFPNVNTSLYKTAISGLLNSNNVIPRSHKRYWQESFNNLQIGSHAEGLVVLLPQLEHLLRVLYCKLNGCTERLLTAEATEFYTTIDEILSPNYQSQDNRILEFLGFDLVIMIEDIFSYPEGPRLRDKLSHWEFCVFDTSNQMAVESFANCVSCIVLCVVIVTEAADNLSYQKKLGKENKDVDMSKQDIQRSRDVKECSENGLIGILENLKRSYVPKFHPISYLLRSIECQLNRLQFADCLPKPADIDVSLNTSTCDRDVNNLREKLLKIFGQVMDVAPLIISNDASRLTDFIKMTVTFLTKIEFSTFNRPRSETILVSGMRHVMKEIGSLNESLVHTSELKYKQWIEHKMRSRARQIYTCMCQVRPYLLDTVYCITIMFLCEIQSLVFVKDQSVYSSMQRFFKLTLKFVQNVVTYCSVERNQWHEILKCISEYTNCAYKYVDIRWNV